MKPLYTTETDSLIRFNERAEALREAIDKVNRAQREDADNRSTYFEEKYALLDSFRVLSGIPPKRCKCYR